MLGVKKYYRIPLLTRLLKIRFYIKWIDGRLYNIGFDKNYGCKMSLMEAICRLEKKRREREFY